VFHSGLERFTDQVKRLEDEVTEYDIVAEYCATATGDDLLTIVDLISGKRNNKQVRLCIYIHVYTVNRIKIKYNIYGTVEHTFEQIYY